MATLVAGAAAALGGGVHTIFNYNRENFKYDREMRQRGEFKVLDFRARQAGMWRQDVRDLIGMTENRMDRYLIMTTIQLGMTLGLFTEGRLEAGTPQWLLRFYMLSLGSAFLFLLMSVWLAMHASVVAQTSGTRLLTQFVRLPIPTWKHLNKMRTYAASFETLGSNMVRVPFIKSPDAPVSTWNKTGTEAWASAPPGSHTEMDYRGTPGTYTSKDDLASQYSYGSSQNGDVGEEENHFDVWGLEEQGHAIDELKAQAPANRPHIGMVKEESLHWQCHDLFTRVTMTLGTTHLIFALIYYCLGYISIQDGAPMPSWCVVAVMLCAAITIIYLDFIIPPEELQHAIVLISSGPILVSFTTFLMAARSPNVGTAYTFCLPIAYLAHAGFLYWFLNALGMEKHVNGAWLPMRFRPMAYLDVFHWYYHTGDSEDDGSEAPSDFEAASTFLGVRLGKVFKLGDAGLGYYDDPIQDAKYSDSQPSGSEASGGQDALHHPHLGGPDGGCWPESAAGNSSAGGQAEESEERSAAQMHGEGSLAGDPSWVKIRGTTDLGTELPYLYNERTGDIRSMSFDTRVKSRAEDDAGKRKSPSSGPMLAPATDVKQLQLPKAASKSEMEKDKSGKDVNVITDSFHGPATDYGTVEPGLVPWQMLRSAAWLLIMLWCTGPLLSFHCVGGPLEYGLAPMQFEDAEEANTDRIVKWSPTQMALSAVAGEERMGKLEDGEEISVIWPRRNSFLPKSMSCDPTGKQLVVADDFGLYKSTLDFGPVIKGNFSRAPPCTIFEGQLLKDIGVVCLGGSEECRILVLHNNGHEISECPLHPPRKALLAELPWNALLEDSAQKAEGDVAATKASAQARSNSTSVLPSRSRNLMQRKVSPIVTWKLAGEWRANKERVQSMAVNKFSKNCLAQASLSPGDSKSGQAFLPKGPGCIVVGTSSGRIIGLRRHVTESRELVPEINMQHRPHSVTQGSLRILFNGIIVALRHTGVLQALEMKSGVKIGQWRLPGGISWITLCATNSHLFILGRDVSAKERRVVLWRFPFPAALQTTHLTVPRDTVGAAQEM